MAKVSVIMPVYNAASFLNRSIESIHNQSLSDIEIVCVDDGSSDNSLEILKDLQKKHFNIKIISQENSGPGIARNTGMQNATGEYIAFLDSDDIFLDDAALEKMYEIGKRYDSNLVGANLRRINQDYTLDDYYDFINSRFAYFTKEDILNPEDYGIPFAFYKNIFKREFIEENKIDFPDLRFGEDPVFMVKVLANIDSFPVVPIDFYGYNHSIGGGVNEKITTFDKKFAYIQHFKDIFDILLNKGLYSILTTYKNEFIDYIIYSDNIHDSEIIEIVRNIFADFTKYFDKTDYGFFLMDYIVNGNFDESVVDDGSVLEGSVNLEEFLFIKKYLFEESSVNFNFIDIETLREYFKFVTKNDYDLNDDKIKKESFNELIKINDRIYGKMELLVEETENLNNTLIAPQFNKNAEFLTKFMESRIDIKNFGNETNDIIIVESDDSSVNVTKPNWFSDDEGIGTVINSVKGSLNLSFKCVNDGRLEIAFKGIDYKDKKDNRIPIYVDYNEIVIDGKTIIEGSRVSWHDNPYIYTDEVKDGQIVDIQLKWAPFTQESNLYVMPKSEEYLNNFYKSRIDIKNSGDKTNRLMVVESDDPSSIIYEPHWLNDDNGIGTVVFSIKGEIDLSFKCINDGDLEIDFKSFDFRDHDNKKIPIFIDYTEIIVDGEYVLGNSCITWHDNPFVYKEKVKDGQIINIKAKWRPLLHYSNLNMLFDTENPSEKYYKSRIDIKNYGKENNEIILMECDDSLSEISHPSWFNNKRGKGTILTSLKGDMNFSFKCVNDGRLEIGFRSVDFRDKNNHKLPIYIDYSEIIVDGEKIVDGSTVLWHDNQLFYKKEVKDSQIVNVQVKWSPISKNSNFKIINTDIDNKFKKIEELKQKVETLKKENQELNSLKEDLLNSNSWKLLHR